MSWIFTTLGASPTFSEMTLNATPALAPRLVSSGSPANWWEISSCAAIRRACWLTAWASKGSRCSADKPRAPRSWLAAESRYCSARLTAFGEEVKRCAMAQGKRPSAAAAHSSNFDGWSCFMRRRTSLLFNPKRGSWMRSTMRRRMSLWLHRQTGQSVADGFPRLPDSMLETCRMAPAQAVQATDVHQFARRSVGLRRVKGQLPIEADHAGDGLGQFADGDVLPGSNVDERRRVLNQQGTVALVVEVHQETARLGQIVGIEQFASRRAGSPDDHLLRTRSLGLGSLANERGKNVRVSQIEVVPGPVKVSRHRGKVARSILAVVAPAHLDPRDLGNRIRTVGWLQRPGQQVLLFDRLRAELRINAGGAEKEQTLHSSIPAGLDYVRLNDQVVADEVGGVAVVGEDASNLGGREEDKVGLRVGKERIDRNLVAEIKFLMCASDDIPVLLTQQFAMDGGAYQTAMASDIDAPFGMHESDVRRGGRDGCRRHRSGLVDVICVVAVAEHKRVALGGIQVRFHHLADEFIKADAGHPAKLALRLARVAQQRLHLCGAEVARVYSNNEIARLVDHFLVVAGALPCQIEFEQLGASLHKFANAVLPSGREDVILRLLLL